MTNIVFNLMNELYFEIIFVIFIFIGCFCALLYIKQCEKIKKQKILNAIRTIYGASLLILCYLYVRWFYIDVIRNFLAVDSIPVRITYFIAIASCAFGFLLIYFERDRLLSCFRVLQLRLTVNSNIHAWFYPVILMIILLSGAVIQLSIIGDYYFWTDEAYSYHAAKMILEKGEPLYDSGLYYGRASVYHNLMALSMQMFGVNEFGSRVINVLANGVTTFLLYFALRKTSKTLGIFVAFLFMFSSFTIAMTIETRFYAFFTMAFFGMIFAYYKAFLESDIFEKDEAISFLSYSGMVLKKWNWLILFLLFFYLSYNTHNFYSLFVFGLACYYALSLFLDKDRHINLILFLVCFGAIYAGAYYLTGSFDLYYAYFEEATLGWASDRNRNPAYYFGRIHDNIPFYFLLITPSLVMLFASFSKLQRYYYSLMVGGFLIIFPQRAAAERYMASFVPIIFILTALSLFYILTNFKKYKLGRHLVVLIIALYMFLHLQVFAEEVFYQEYEGRLSAHKKLLFPQAMELIDEKLEDNVVLLADFHAIYTLIAYGYDPDYLLISEQKGYNIERGIEIDGVLHEHYFEVPFLIMENFPIRQIAKDEKVLIVSRQALESLEGFEVIQGNPPYVYVNY